MGDLIFKLSGPSRAIELQIPIGPTVSKLDMVKNLITGGDTEEDDSNNDSKKKKKQKQDKNNVAKAGIGTIGILAASVLLAAMKDDG